MPRVTPTQIVEFIDSAFPRLRDHNEIRSLGESHLQTISTLVAFLDRLQEDVLANFSTQQFRDYLICLEHLRAAVNRWQIPETIHTTNKIRVDSLPALGNNHPVQVVRDLMRNCPEEPVAEAQDRLSFLKDPDLEQSIAIDIASAESAIADGRYKNACVMAGSALEALLLWAVQRRTAVERKRAFAQVQARRQKQEQQLLDKLHSDPRRWGLEQYIEIARELPVLSNDSADAAMLAKDFRNLIHPGRAERLQRHATRGNAAQALAALILTLEDLESRVSQGQL